MPDPADTLAEQILADARKQAEPLRRRAAREVPRLLEHARARAERERAQILARAQERAGLAARRVQARAELEADNIRREAAEQILSAVRDRALEELTELARSERYAHVLAALAAAAAQTLGTGGYELVFCRRDREALGERVAAELRERLAAQAGGGRAQVTVSEETEPARGGLVVWSADGRRFCDQTFEARLGRLWESLREETAADLLPEETAEARAGTQEGKEA